MHVIYDTKFLKIHYSFLFPETYGYFRNYALPTNDKQVDIFTTKEEIVLNPYGFKYNGLNPFSEFQHLMVKTGMFLLNHDSCMFHGTLMKWKDMGVLFTGPSGIGKTTQYRLWKQFEGDSVEIVNGDKPILEYDGHQIIGHSSPWNGKEQFGIAGYSIPLKAVVILEQSDTNKIEQLPSSNTVIPLFKQFIAYPDNIEIIKQEAVFLDRMLENVPVWKLTNKGDLDSAILTRNTLETYYGL